MNGNLTFHSNHSLETIGQILKESFRDKFKKVVYKLYFILAAHFNLIYSSPLSMSC